MKIERAYLEKVLEKNEKMSSIRKARKTCSQISCFVLKTRKIAKKCLFLHNCRFFVYKTRCFVNYTSPRAVSHEPYLIDKRFINKKRHFLQKKERFHGGMKMEKNSKIPISDRANVSSILKNVVLNKKTTWRYSLNV